MERMFSGVNGCDVKKTKQQNLELRTNNEGMEPVCGSAYRAWLGRNFIMLFVINFTCFPLDSGTNVYSIDFC